MAKILGVASHYHDAAAALIVDGRVVAAADEERFSRVKHDSRFPRNAIEFCLAKGGISGNELDYAVFYENPKLKLDRILRTTLKHSPYSRDLFVAALRSYLTNKYWIRTAMSSFLDCDTSAVVFCEHHLSHACSAFFCSPFSDAAVVTIDGVGEWNTVTASVCRDGQILKLYEIDFPHSVGLLYSAFTAFLRFRVNDGEYRVMGLAPYGRPNRMDDMWKLVSLHGDGKFALNLDYFSWEYDSHRLYSDKFLELFGQPRPEDLELDFDGRGNDDKNGVGLLAQQYADIAASAQKLVEEIVLHIVRHIHDVADSDSLCLAGGVALNSVANHRIRQETNCSHIFVQPAAGDAGCALGAALYWNQVVLENGRSGGRMEPFNPYLGEEFTESDCRNFLSAQAVPYSEFENTELLCARVAQLLSENKIVGWCQGRFEWGPRSLGNRSILANPTHPNMKEIVNRKIKFREPFRPFAPAVLEECLEDYFEIRMGDHSTEYSFSTLYYMLEVVKFRVGKRALFPSVAHVDGSGRVQAVSKKLNPLFWQLINEYKNVTGIPILLNTSFNVKGEPIARGINDAYDTFLGTDIDVLVIGNFVVSK